MRYHHFKGVKPMQKKAAAGKSRLASVGLVITAMLPFLCAEGTPGFSVPEPLLSADFDKSLTGISLRKPSNTMRIFSSAVNFRRVALLTLRISFLVLPGLAFVSSLLSNTWVVSSISFSFSVTFIIRYQTTQTKV
jgi:hypothetical protein